MAASGPYRDRTWALALLVSLILHAGVGLVLFLLPGPGPGTAASGCLAVDACTLEGEEGSANFLTAGSDTAPMQAVLVAPVLYEPASPAAAPSEPLVRVAEPQAPPSEPWTPASPLAPSPVAPPGIGKLSPGLGRANQGPAAEKRGNSTRFFDVEAQGQTFVYVIDHSSSMGPGGGLAAARQQLLTSLQELPPAARFQVIVYNRTAEPLVPACPYWLDTTPENIQQVALRLDGLIAEGGTDHWPALRRALALRPDVLFFLTDADDLTAELLRAVAQLNVGRHTVIHTIELNTLHRDRPDMPMHVLARENHGTYRALDLQSQTPERGD